MLLIVVIDGVNIRNDLSASDDVDDVMSIICFLSTVDWCLAIGRVRMMGKLSLKCGDVGRGEVENILMLSMV